MIIRAATGETTKIALRFVADPPTHNLSTAKHTGFIQQAKRIIPLKSPPDGDRTFWYVKYAIITK